MLLHHRRFPIGAESTDHGVHFRVWAPRRTQVEIVAANQSTTLINEGNGYFSGLAPWARVGTRYRFRLDSGEAFPDPASRYQPEGPHEASAVVDPFSFAWTDGEWRGLTSERQIVYEMHIGTFTNSGTFAAARDHLPALAELGITAVEVMPVADFPGRFGWGYDGVSFFAPYHGYGTPDDFRAFVNRAHELGVGVVLDVVYNHFGPDGNYLGQFSDGYVSQSHQTEWGDALNYDGPGSAPVREFVISNARHWIEEYHLDGLRLDATHSIYDDSPTHILFEVGQAARRASGDRSIIVIAESEPQDPRTVRAPAAGGYGLDHVWCDDFHHSAIVAAGREREGYYADYRGTPQELVSALTHGILHEGPRFRWQQERKLGAWDVPSHRQVFYLENHDQVANSRDGRRLHQVTSPGMYRALTALLLLARQTPMLFQGQEFGASSPFLYFADHKPELARLVRKGRGEFLEQFSSIGKSGGYGTLDDPADPDTFARSRLDVRERQLNAAHYALHRDLIALRKSDCVIGGVAEPRVDGGVLTGHAFVVRLTVRGQGTRLLVVNLGPEAEVRSTEALLVSPESHAGWRRLWHSDAPAYGADGGSPLRFDEQTWRIRPESATLLAAVAT